MTLYSTPNALSDLEYEAMVREFDLAGDWMSDQLRQTHNPAGLSPELSDRRHGSATDGEDEIR